MLIIFYSAYFEVWCTRLSHFCKGVREVPLRSQGDAWNFTLKRSGYLNFLSETKRYVKFRSKTKGVHDVSLLDREVHEILRWNQKLHENSRKPRSYVKFLSPTKRCVKFTLRRNAAWTEKKKKVPKLCPKVRISSCIVYVQATSVPKECNCWVDCVLLHTSLWKVVRFTNEWNKFHILKLTHQETDLSPLRPARSTLSFSVTG